VRGELDWIVMKALDKDRGRRYDSANGLALDVERYLRNEVVAAGPPSAAYRLRKLWQSMDRGTRVMWWLAGVLWLIFLFLVLPIAGYIVMAQERRARQAQVEATRARFMTLMQEKRARQEMARRKASEAQAVLDFWKENLLATAPEAENGGRPGADLPPRSALDRAEAALQSASVGDPVAEASIRATLGETYLGLGDTARAIRHLDQAVSLRRQALGPDNPDTLRSMSRLADAYLAGGRVAQALPLCVEAVSRGKAAMGDESYDLLTLMNNLGRAYLASEPATAEPILREALAGWMRKDHDDWHTFEAAALLGRFLLIQKDYRAAEAYLLQGYEGLKSRAARIPDISRRRIAETRARIVELYEAWGKPEKAAEWRPGSEKKPDASPKEK